jgi:hypothetical protein
MALYLRPEYDDEPFKFPDEYGVLIRCETTEWSEDNNVFKVGPVYQSGRETDWQWPLYGYLNGHRCDYKARWMILETDDSTDIPLVGIEIYTGHCKFRNCYVRHKGDLHSSTQYLYKNSPIDSRIDNIQLSGGNNAKLVGGNSAHLTCKDWGEIECGECALVMCGYGTSVICGDSSVVTVNHNNKKYEYYISTYESDECILPDVKYKFLRGKFRKVKPLKTDVFYRDDLI